MISNLNETVSTGQVKNLFDNVSAGINQLAGGIFSQGMPPMFMGSGSGSEDKKKIVQQIPVTLTASKPAAPAPENKPEA
jgi:chlorosome envelope protein H